MMTVCRRSVLDDGLFCSPSVIVKFNETKNLSYEYEVKMTYKYINPYQNLESVNTLIPHLENQ